MNWDKVTLEDCIEMCEKKGKSATVNDGHIIGFEQEQVD